MSRFLDGPAAGTTLLLGRAPVFLRAVQNTTGTWDALDQLEDEPQHDELIVLYQQVSEPRMMHLQRSVKGQRVCGWYLMADYRVVTDPPEESILRSRPAWQRWAMAEAPKRFIGKIIQDPLKP